MSEKEFNDHQVCEVRRHPSKLDPYRQFITDELRNAPFLSCPQVLDHLKEHFDNPPYIGERTIYNYVQRIREEEDIPKSSEPVRQMRHVPDCEYGEKAQVDYGEKIISNTKGRLTMRIATGCYTNSTISMTCCMKRSRNLSSWTNRRKSIG